MLLKTLFILLKNQMGRIEMISLENTNPEMTWSDTLEVTWSRTMKIWWSYIWRCMLFTMIPSFVLGFIGAIIFVLMGRHELVGMFTSILGSLLSIPVSIIVLKIILQKEFKEFSIYLISKEGPGYTIEKNSSL